MTETKKLDVFDIPEENEDLREASLIEANLRLKESPLTKFQESLVKDVKGV
jgi:hypothetical protein